MLVLDWSSALSLPMPTARLRLLKRQASPCRIKRLPLRELTQTFELSTGEAKSVEVPATQSKQSAEIHVYGEPRVSFFDASNTAPACVVAEHQLTSVKVRNDCPTPVRVKVVMTGPVGAQDAACSAIEPGAQETVAHLMVPGVTRIDRVENC